MRCLGVDIGSSSIKRAILDLESGHVPSIIKEPFPGKVIESTAQEETLPGLLAVAREAC